MAHEPSGAPSRPRSRTSDAADRIKDLILTRRLRPGDPVPTESELTDTLGVSRSSVREAVRTLSALGIVDVRHGHGTFVGELSLDPLVETLVFRGALQPGDGLRALREVIEVREALDVAMAERLAEAARGTHDADLWALVATMEESARDGETFAASDRAFHAALHALTGNSLVGPLVAAFSDVHTAVVRHLGACLPDDLAQTARAHRDMLEAVEAGDAPGYREAVRRHYAPLVRALDAAA
ncbi:GntR domain protein [Cellulomonas flavigena DSM 20109]|uniref:GntR domain protein n=1 Tax=Cellulomonas flavigena (strain ATCC 482 / DSM 20109 / BCRC 11376 / JCM 18109 / NBRC 3775 / NCIMB 8073 / NRS 134) TaxID=446466 RepID=D5ULZ9_CELFN|nr:FadR/GntR family transcriptional regulator [Cellulomonas flavigena]ADG76105.1 GntR domain protein [Cellulomonas flavigena DSM 20109]